MPKRDIVPKKTAVDLLTTVGAVIRAHRLRLGVTQEELAWRANIHRSYLADIERGGRNLTLSSIANLANALEVSLKDLLRQSDDKMEAGCPPRTSLPEILLVEDNPDDVALTLRAFQRARFDNPIKVVTDGQVALDYLRCAGRFVRREARMPQLVLLDLNLPKVSGLEVLRQMKADQGTRDVPVIVLTASHDARLIMECSRLGAANYITKPVLFENFSKITPDLGLNWALVHSTAAYPTVPIR